MESNKKKLLDHQKHPHKHLDYYTSLPSSFILPRYTFSFPPLSLTVSSNSPQLSSL